MRPLSVQDASDIGPQHPAPHGQNENALFAGHDLGAENWPCIASLIETCKLNGVDPQAYFTDVLTNSSTYGPSRASTTSCPGPGRPSTPPSWRRDPGRSEHTLQCQAPSPRGPEDRLHFLRPAAHISVGCFYHGSPRPDADIPAELLIENQFPSEAFLIKRQKRELRHAVSSIA
jgi:hypothetical protein